jgi:hypothetical protein
MQLLPNHCDAVAVVVLELLGEVIVSVTGMVNGAGRVGEGACPEVPPEVADVTPELIVTWPV